MHKAPLFDLNKISPFIFDFDRVLTDNTFFTDQNGTNRKINRRKG